MKHIVVGVGVAAAVVITFTIWALLGELVGPAWALAIMVFAVACGLGAGALDYLTEKENA